MPNIFPWSLSHRDACRRWSFSVSTRDMAGRDAQANPFLATHIGASRKIKGGVLTGIDSHLVTRVAARQTAWWAHFIIFALSLMRFNFFHHPTLHTSHVNLPSTIIMPLFHCRSALILSITTTFTTIHVYSSTRADVKIPSAILS